MANDCDAVLIGICCCHGVAFYRGNPVVGAVGEMAYMKRRKLWKMGCVAPAVPSKPGWVPRHCWKNGVKSPLFLLFLCRRLPPKLGEAAKVYR